MRATTRERGRAPDTALCLEAVVYTWSFSGEGERLHETAHKVSCPSPHPLPAKGRGERVQGQSKHPMVDGYAVVGSLSPFFTGRGWGEGLNAALGRRGRGSKHLGIKRPARRSFRDRACDPQGARASGLRPARCP